MNDATYDPKRHYERLIRAGVDHTILVQALQIVIKRTQLSSDEEAETDLVQHEQRTMLLGYAIACSISCSLRDAASPSAFMRERDSRDVRACR